MVELLMKNFGYWDPSQVSDVFLYATLVLILITRHSAARGRHQPFIQFAPTLLTTIRILGTFTGISIGLPNFDSTDQATIDRSIPLLLGGLKTAFITSIAGMSTSIVAKSFAGGRPGWVKRWPIAWGRPRFSMRSKSSMTA